MYCLILGLGYRSLDVSVFRAAVQRGCQYFVHLFRVAPFEEIPGVTIPGRRGQAPRDQNVGIGSFVAFRRVGRTTPSVAGSDTCWNALVASGPCLRFAVANDTSHNQTGIVECHAVGGRNSVANSQIEPGVSGATCVGNAAPVIRSIPSTTQMLELPAIDRFRHSVSWFTH